MVAIDCHHLSVVEEVGFRRILDVPEPRYTCPSCKYYTDTIIPKIFSGMKDEIGKLINSEEGSISFTTDIWSCSVNDTSLLSLTAHWINNSFEKQSAVLHAQSLEMAHTGEYIASCISTMLDKWDISHNCVHLVLSDNASNMVKAMQDASLPHFGCFAHSLQVVVKDGLLSQRAIADITAVVRALLDRLSIASHNLTRIQQSLGIPQHKLKQEVATRWNSTLCMYQSVLEQKMALAAYSAAFNNFQHINWV